LESFLNVYHIAILYNNVKLLINKNLALNYATPKLVIPAHAITQIILQNKLEIMEIDVVASIYILYTFLYNSW